MTLWYYLLVIVSKYKFPNSILLLQLRPTVKLNYIILRQLCHLNDKIIYVGLPNKTYLA